ncbi:MAG TPA: GrpB family protein [Proteiniclasticum sp.]|nr:GrpB family protein [Proteiniclasticum sp.]
MSREMLVVPYNEVWSDLYNTEKELLASVFKERILDIQHFGSTAIKGMSAKPIIDILIVVDDIDQIDRYDELMERNGYSARGENGIVGRRYYVKLDPDNSGNHTHHIHIYQKGNSHIFDELMFRDYLRGNRQSFMEYEQIKLEASLRYRHSPKDYVEAKNDCVMRIMDREYKHYNISEDLIEVKEQNRYDGKNL